MGTSYSASKISSAGIGELQYSLGLLLAEQQRLPEAADALDKAAKLQGRASGGAPLFLRADDAYAWLQNGGAAVEAWRQGGTFSVSSSSSDDDTLMLHLPPSRSCHAKRSQTGAVPKVLRDQVWMSAFGQQSALGCCACCKRAIHITDWEAGHVVSRACGGRTVADNLRPVCRGCNRSMSCRNMDEFIAEHFPGVGVGHVAPMEC